MLKYYYDKSIHYLLRKLLAVFKRLILVVFVVTVSSCETDPKVNKAPIIVILNPNPALSPVVDGFKSGLKERGFAPEFIEMNPGVGGKNLDNVFADLDGQHVDLFYTATTNVTKLVKQRLRNEGVPMIFSPLYDPIRSGVVDDLVEHGGVTGVKTGGNNAKALDWLLRMSPGVKQVLVPFNQAIAVEHFSLADLQRAANKLSVQLVVVQVKTREELSEALDEFPSDIDALWLLHSEFLVPKVDLFVRSAIRHQIPLASGAAQYDKGVMLTYGQDYYQTGKQVARLASLIFQGIATDSIPVETADFFLGINLITAREAGVDVPYGILQQAEYIVR